jgi:hypothetical protein
MLAAAVPDAASWLLALMWQRRGTFLRVSTQV